MGVALADRHPGEQRDVARTGIAVEAGEPLLLARESYEELGRDRGLQRVGVPSVDWLGVPLRGGDGTFGVLVVQTYSESIRYGERERDLLAFVSRHIAGAIERKRSEEIILQMAYYDTLTGLSNRTLFIDRLALAVAHARRTGDGLGLVFLEEQAQLPGEKTIKLAVMATVMLSIFAHGFSALPGIDLYARKVATLDAMSPEKRTN